jgi:alkylhydroperoxidase family enzyme
VLIRQQVARLNVCSFCIDIGRWAAIKETMDRAKLDALGEYSTSPLFSDAERAALDYVTELTKEKRVDQKTFARMSNYYSEREICEIVWLVASEHLYNIANIGLNIHSDGLCDVSERRLSDLRSAQKAA